MIRDIFHFGDDNGIPVFQVAEIRDRKMPEEEVRIIKTLTSVPFSLTVFLTDDWNSDLTPWKAEGVHNSGSFGDGAHDTLETVLQEAVKHERSGIIAGYSLSALFALWSAYQTDAFCRVAACSPSVWYPGFIEYIQDRQLSVDHVYLSIGDREGFARNPVLRCVDSKVKVIAELLGPDKSYFEYNSGNHFTDVPLRIAKGIAWEVLKYSTV
ncbi:MAG: hypothetical protein ACI4NM_00150 [Bullifex sp.]